MLVGFHALLAHRSGDPEWLLSPEEAAELPKRLQNVARHYNITATQKTLDWGALVFSLASTYATRVIAIRMRHAREAEGDQRQERASNVHPLMPMPAE